MRNLFWWGIYTLSLFSYAGALPPGCEYDKECFIDAPGMKCADGTASYFTITPRKNAKNLLVYLHSGGACWNKSSCEKGLARPLTRVVTNTNWSTGEGIFNQNEPMNPFRADYDIITVPYCTGDLFTGNKTVNYGSESAPYILQHRGFTNIAIVLTEVQKLYPFPEKVALVGQSAGGMGVLYHAKSLETFFPTAKKYILDDSGIPFEPPYITERRYLEVMKNWGADETFPYDNVRTLKAHTFGTLIEMNKEFMPTARFGLVAAYSDYVMTFFALSVGSPSAFTAVRNTLINAANKYVSDSSQAKVFFINNKDHMYLHRSLNGISSEGVKLGSWLTAMMSDEEVSWTNVRPDLHRPIDPLEPHDFYRALERSNYLQDLN